MSKIKQNILLIRPPSGIFKDYMFHRLPHPRCLEPPHLLKYLQALLLDKGYQVKLVDGYIDLLNQKLLLKLFREVEYNFCVFSGTTHTVSILLSLAKVVKNINPEIIVFAVGQHATYKPQDFIFKNSPIDYILKGEYEIEALNLIEKLSKDYSLKSTEEISYKGENNQPVNLIDDLDNLPFPCFTKRELNKYKFFFPLPIAKKVTWGHILTNRGCPHGCIFCSQIFRKTFGKVVRYRSPENIVDEMELLKKKGVNVIIISDDDFTIPSYQVKNVCNEIIRRNLSINWVAHSRVDEVNNELLKIMGKAGCVFLRFGIESGCRRVISMLKKTKHSDEWSERAINVFKLCKEYGISTVACFIIGSPDETEEEIRESIGLAKKLKPDVIQVHFFTPYPGSEVFEFYKDKMEGSQREGWYHYLGKGFTPSKLSNSRLIELQSNFYAEIFFNFSYLKNHLKKYFIFYLLNFDILLVFLKFGFGLIKKTIFRRELSD